MKLGLLPDPDQSEEISPVTSPNRQSPNNTLRKKAIEVKQPEMTP